ncbi:zf-HC2 domain-containing protein [Caldinitratiruptor microaerophilus]|uniref:Anti-sigma-W factor RsiW n=1 Tax=Caldinitratiruptor microaerophilus TaxID=671077 RepID=A0AA35CKL1_9FIRM|nr:zf-HC2 domain-containing protein [Caldinitratiruptor microaerophilus]BDG61019.1 hypothetical protein caldi_21090 [Caldinitratiruptor microaerophilus]
MNCEGVRQHLSAYIDGELHELARLQVEHHLGRCAACATEEALLRRTVAMLHDLADPDLEVPPGFRESLHARLAALPPPVAAARPAVVPAWERVRRSWRRAGVPAAAAAAAAAILALAYSPAGPFGGTRPVPLAGGAGLTGPSTAPATAADVTRVDGPGAPAARPDGAGSVAAGPSSGSSGSGPVTGRSTPGPGAGVRAQTPGAKPGAGGPQPGEQAGTPTLPGMEPSIPVNGLSAGVAGAEGAKPARVEKGTLVAITYRVRLEVPDIDQALRAVETAIAGLGGGVVPSEERIYWVPADKQDEARAALREIALRQTGRVASEESGQVDYSEQYTAAYDDIRAAKETLANLDEYVRTGVWTPQDAAAQRAKLEAILETAERNRDYWWDRAHRVEFVVTVEKVAAAAAPAEPAGPAPQP